MNLPEDTAPGAPPQDLAQSLQAAVGALELLKATLQGEGTEDAPNAIVPATFSDVISELTTSLAKIAEQAPAAHAAIQSNAAGLIAAQQLQMQHQEQQQQAAEDKVVAVPTRHRSSRQQREGAGDGDDAPPEAQNTQSAGGRTITVELPATPFDATAAAVVAEAGAGAPPPSQAPRPTPGIPADTPMAAEVLASLYALGLAAPPARAGPRPPAPAGGRRASSRSSSGSGGSAAARRSAAIRAAQTGVGFASRPRKPTAAVLAMQAGAAGQGMGGGIRGCNCKRSQCLKLYCDCFAGGGYCLPTCTCLNCVNNEVSADTVQTARLAVLSKDPTAFEDKVTAREGHKKGCRCKRSKCLKKYCECFNAGAKCNPEVCQCEGCKNNGPDEIVGLYGDAPAPPPPVIITRPAPTFDFKSPATDSVMAALLALGDENARTNKSNPSSGGGKVLSVVDLAPGVTEERQQQQQQQQQQQMRPQEGAQVDGVPPPGPNPIPPTAQQGGEDGGSLAAADGPVKMDTSSLPSSPIKIGIEAVVAPIPATEPQAKPASTAPVGAGSGSGSGSGSDGGLAGGTKRPRRAASGGVQGAVAAAASDWGLDVASPPPKRPSSLPDVANAKRAEDGGAAAIAAAAVAAAIGGAATQEIGNAEDEALTALVGMGTLV